MSTTANAPVCALLATQRVYDTEYAHCPRSPEWKYLADKGQV